MAYLSNPEVQARASSEYNVCVLKQTFVNLKFSILIPTSVSNISCFKESSATRLIESSSILYRQIFLKEDIINRFYQLIQNIYFFAKASVASPSSSGMSSNDPSPRASKNSGKSSSSTLLIKLLSIVCFLYHNFTNEFDLCVAGMILIPDLAGHLV